MSKNYILTGIGREKFPGINDYIGWVTRLSKTDIDFIVTDLGVAADIKGFLEMIRPSFKLSPDPGIPHRFGVVSIDGSYVPLSVEITFVNSLLTIGEWSTDGFLEIFDLNGSGRAEFSWVPDIGTIKLNHISGDEFGNPRSVFLDNLESISGLKDYLYVTTI